MRTSVRGDERALLELERDADEVGRLLALEDGWDSYDGLAPTEAAARAGVALKNALTVLPLARGGVQLEAHAGGIDLEIELGPDGKLRGVACESHP